MIINIYLIDGINKFAFMRERAQRKKAPQRRSQMIAGANCKARMPMLMSISRASVTLCLKDRG